MSFDPGHKVAVLTTSGPRKARVQTAQRFGGGDLFYIVNMGRATHERSVTVPAAQVVERDNA